MDEAINEVREQLGLPIFRISEGNIFVLPEDAYEKVAGEIEDEEYEVATSDTENQHVYLRERIARQYPLHAALALAHELIHQRQALSFEIPEAPIKHEGLRKSAVPYREGLGAYATVKKIREGKDHEHFTGLDEAVVENFVMRHLKQRILNNPAFAAEREWLTTEEAKHIQKEVARRESIPEEDAREEIAWVSPDGRGEPFSYRPQREVLSYLAQEIATQFPDRFKSPSDVINLFEEGLFIAPRLLTIGRYIEKTFGKGSFRLLGEMDDDSKNPQNRKILEELRRRRFEIS